MVLIAFESDLFQSTLMPPCGLPAINLSSRDIEEILNDS